MPTRVSCSIRPWRPAAIQRASRPTGWSAACCSEGKAAEAAARAEKLLPKLANGPQAAQVAMDQADAVYEIPARRGEAIALYAALAAKYPQDAVAPQALYMAGFAALGQADYANALKHAAAFLAAYPNHDLAADVGYITAESQLQLGQLAEAEKLLAQLVEKYPGHADADSWRVRRGLALQLQKKPDEAVKVLQAELKDIKSPEALAEARYLIGGSQIELKQFDAAGKSLSDSLAAAPRWRQADETLLRWPKPTARRTTSTRPRRRVRKLIAEFPQSKVLDRATYRLAEYGFAGGDWKAAAADYQQVLDKWPASALAPYALYGLGWAKLNQNDYAGAEKAIDALVERYGSHALTARGRYARGMARQQLGKHAPAIEDLRAFLAADPSPAEKAAAGYVLGLCQAGLKKYAEAAATFQGLLKDSPKSAINDKVLYELGWALKQKTRRRKRPMRSGNWRSSRPTARWRPRPVTTWASSLTSPATSSMRRWPIMRRWRRRARRNWARRPPTSSAGPISGWTISTMPRRPSPISGPTGPAVRWPAMPPSWKPNASSSRRSSPRPWRPMAW